MENIILRLKVRGLIDAASSRLPYLSLLIVIVVIVIAVIIVVIVIVIVVINPRNLYQVLGVFFPTCTGLMAGVNMQGDLKSPHNNISTGSLASLAVRCTFNTGLILIIIIKRCTLVIILIIKSTLYSYNY